MVLRRTCYLAVFLALGSALAPSAPGQLITGNDSLLDKLSVFWPFDPTQPVTVIDVSKRLDFIAEKLRDAGLIVLKQPDVFSQARLTHFRTDFENVMSKDLNTFHLVLAARINRLDAATTTQSTNLAASLSAPGTAHVNVPAPGSSAPAPAAPPMPPTPTPANVPGTSATLDPTKNAFSGLGLDASTPQAAINAKGAEAAMSLGVDPTVYLDEKKRFLEHLNQIRRINHGPDQNDSSGYGLYLIRLPVSITPGECTHQGFGAELAVTVEHEFPADFLPWTFKNLVINDLVDVLGPVVYEVIRSGTIDQLKTLHLAEVELRWRQAEKKQKFDDLYQRSVQLYRDYGNPQKRIPSVITDKNNFQSSCVEPLARFILRDPRSYPEKAQAGDPSETLVRRFDALAHNSRALLVPGGVLTERDLGELNAELDGIREKIRRGAPAAADDTRNVEEYIDWFLKGIERTDASTNPDDRRKAREAFENLLYALYQTSFDDDRSLIDQTLKVDAAWSKSLTDLTKSIEAGRSARNHLRLSLPTTRNSKQRYPIAPQEVLNFFLEDNIYILAEDARRTSLTKTPRATDIRNNLRHSLYVAYDVMAEARPVPGAIAPLDDVVLMSTIFEAVKSRDFGPDGQLQRSFKKLVSEIKKGRENIYNQSDKSYYPIAALCWAIAVDAGLLDDSLKSSIPKVAAAHDAECAIPDELHFYFRAEPLIAAAKPIFNAFVKYHWPIITFALDPVTDQQNLADSYTLQRDLQLALSFAFATGQISFSQMNTFRRQIQQSSDTIALNRTVTGFIHGNDTFGFRFTPRFQNPPNQRTNIGVIASQLIGGGPGPDYQMKKSKLEPGLRELTAVLLIPTFLPTMRMQISSNWFKLHDPEHLVFHTKRMLERGREVQELRQAAVDACSREQYRPADLNVLEAKLKQLEAMLPAQSKVVQLPFENTVSGFELYSDGATALVPELAGYEGIDTITRAAGTAATVPLADIFIYGKYFDLLDTKVIVGGSYVPPSPAAAPTTGGYEILSREVIHVQIPSTAQQTVTVDGQTYVEVYVATPNGISNRVLVPYQAVTPPPLVAFDLDPSTQELDIYYQWFPKADANAKLIATADPGSSPIKIAWDAATGMAPKTLLATFTATIGTQTLSFSLPANSGVQDAYTVDTQVMTVKLLKRLQALFPPPTIITTPFTMKVSVQPYLPLDAMGYRVVSSAKTLKTPLTVKLIYNVTDKDALPGVVEPPPPPALAPAKKAGPAKASAVFPEAESVRTVSLQASDTSTGPLGLLRGAGPLPVPAQLPQSLGDLATSPLMAVQGLPGQLVPPGANPLTTLETTGSNLAVNAANLAGERVTPAQLQSVIHGLNAPPTINLNPSSVVVVAPPAASKSRSLLSRIFHRSQGSRPNAAP
jgi:hypothetical protein